MTPSAPTPLQNSCSPPGSTGNPKAVINTQRMITADQATLRETLAFLKDEPPVIVDWLPWTSHFWRQSQYPD